METAMAVDALNPASSNDPVKRQQMPLTFLKAGEKARILKVRGDEDFHHHLENLGFVPGAVLRVASEQSGNIIVEIKGTRIALDRKSASKVITY